MCWLWITVWEQLVLSYSDLCFRVLQKSIAFCLETLGFHCGVSQMEQAQWEGMGFKWM